LVRIGRQGERAQRLVSGARELRPPLAEHGGVTSSSGSRVAPALPGDPARHGAAPVRASSSVGSRVSTLNAANWKSTPSPDEILVHELQLERVVRRRGHQRGDLQRGRRPGAALHELLHQRRPLLAHADVEVQHVDAASPRWTAMARRPLFLPQDEADDADEDPEGCLPWLSRGRLATRR
jgi:hypothetical protein